MTLNDIYHYYIRHEFMVLIGYPVGLLALKLVGQLVWKNVIRDYVIVQSLVIIYATVALIIIPMIEQQDREANPWVWEKIDKEAQ